MIGLGLGGFALGILFGVSFWSSRKQDEKPSISHFSEASKKVRHERSGSAGKTHDAELQVFFHSLLSGLPPDQQSKIRSRLAPLLREVSALGIGESAYVDLAILAVSEAARENPEATFRYLLGQGDPLSQLGSREVLHEWMLQEPDSAAKAVAGLPPGEAKDFFKERLLQETISADPAKALESLKASKNPHPPDYYYLFINLAKNGVESAIQQAGEISDPALRARATAGLAVTYAKANPDKAWDWALTNERDPEFLAASTVLAEILKTDPALALRKIESIQSPAVKGRIVARNIQELGKQNPEAAYLLVNKTLTGYNRYCALSGMMALGDDGTRLPQIKQMVENEPVGKYRDDLAASFVQSWARTDPSAAYEWLKENGNIHSLPEELQGQLSRGEKPPGSDGSGIRF